VAPVERATLTERGRYPGELDADAADVSSFYTGRLTSVHVRVGDLVDKGQVVAEIDPIDAREQIARARAQAQAAAAEERRVAIDLGVARRQLERFERLREQVSVSEIDAQRSLTESLESAVATAEARGAEARAGVRLLEKRVFESEIRAPFAGRVAARHVDPGVVVAAGSPLVRVAATAPLRVRFEVPEQDVAGLAVGTRLQVVAQAGGQDKGGVAARVTGIAGEVSRDRRVATLEALLESPPESWLPGMYAHVIVDRRVIEGATVVPATAVLSRLQPDGTIATGVLVADREVARWVPVVIAAREGDRVAIEASALAPGARVLVSGHLDLTHGSRIQVADQDRARRRR
jgi:RND family efflux transporter MFP subunit